MSGLQLSEEEIVAIEREVHDVPRDDGLTAEEGVVMDSLVAAFNAFAQLERQHPDELSDFKDGIHRCQDALALRVCRRAFPRGWPIKAAT